MPSTPVSFGCPTYEQLSDRFERSNGGAPVQIQTSIPEVMQLLSEILEDPGIVLTTVEGLNSASTVTEWNVQRTPMLMLLDALEDRCHPDGRPSARTAFAVRGDLLGMLGFREAPPTCWQMSPT